MQTSVTLAGKTGEADPSEHSAAILAEGIGCEGKRNTSGTFVKIVQNHSITCDFSDRTMSKKKRCHGRKNQKQLEWMVTERGEITGNVDNI